MLFTFLCVFCFPLTVWAEPISDDSGTISLTKIQDSGESAARGRSHSEFEKENNYGNKANFMNWLKKTLFFSPLLWTKTRIKWYLRFKSEINVVNYERYVHVVAEDAVMSISEV